ncbi:hypothetical protein RvY_19045-6 [Ramazzottius varieornatus]|uniref:Uncharacterized protein n=1 Tax=Ramazzottius varieornatus TaxID=947166 RepID=A0A1D1W812_RAMVA|nr:hypothetical protein RvY_19045-6 [Ramazzottius varieornatus]
MLIAKTLTSWNSSASNCTTASLLHVEIITLALYCGLDPGGLFYVQPAFEEALRDIGRLYPCVRARHNIISVPEECTDVGLTPFAHDLLGQFYYRNFARWEAANVTSFLTNTAGISVRQNISKIVLPVSCLRRHLWSSCRSLGLEYSKTSYECGPTGFTG